MFNMISEFFGVGDDSSGSYVVHRAGPPGVAPQQNSRQAQAGFRDSGGNYPTVEPASVAEQRDMTVHGARGSTFTQRDSPTTSAYVARDQVSPRPQPVVTRPAVYTPDGEDLLDQHVAYYFKKHPDVYRRVNFIRKRPGVYQVNGREVQVEWQYGTMPGEQGYLAVVDGPLRQPFGDYVTHNEKSAEYDVQGVNKQSALHMIPASTRMTFDDQAKAYTRLEAMKVAKEQALTREKHAQYMNKGQLPPTDLMSQYQKTLNVKLGNPNKRQQWRNPAAMPGAMPVATPGPKQAQGSRQMSTLENNIFGSVPPNLFARPQAQMF